MKTVKLGDIAKISSGGTPSRTNPAYWGGKIPWVKTTQIQNCVISESDVDERITEVAVKQTSVKRVPKGTLLMAMYGQGKTRGQVAILDFDATINQACAAIELEKNVNQQFIYQQLLWKYEDIRNMSNAGGQENLSAGLIREIPIHLPPLLEQKAIADLLSTWDKAIEKTERLIAAKEKRFDALLDDSTIQPLQQAWKEYHLKDVFSERVEINRMDLPLLSISREDGITCRDDTDRKDTSSEDKSKYLRICPGDIGYNTMRMWQGVSALSSLEGIVSPAYTVCIPNAKLVDGKFASYLFKNKWMIHQFYRYSQGLTSDTWNLKFNNFGEIRIHLPSIKEQKSITSALDLAKSELTTMKALLDKYRLQKRGLMQKLLNGQWRVKVA